jgi:hypothetical protein
MFHIEVDVIRNSFTFLVSKEKSMTKQKTFCRSSSFVFWSLYCPPLFDLTPGTPASCHDIAEILLKVALKHKKSHQNQYVLFHYQHKFNIFFHMWSFKHRYVNRKVWRYQKIIRWFKSNKGGQYNDQKTKDDDLQNPFGRKY